MTKKKPLEEKKFRGPQQKPKKDPTPEGPVSAVCDACGVSAPANRVTGKPMQHFDGRVPNAYKTLTYCNGKKS